MSLLRFVLVVMVILIGNIGAVDISSCQDLTSGTYTLTANIANDVGQCFPITGNNVILDCQGRTVAGDGTSGTLNQDSGINVSTGVTGAQIKNCQIDNFSAAIVVMDGANNTLIQNNYMNASDWGVRVSVAHNVTLKNNVVNPKAGKFPQAAYQFIALGTVSTVYNDTLVNNSAYTSNFDYGNGAFDFEQADSLYLANNTAIGAYAGFWFVNVDNSQFYNLTSVGTQQYCYFWQTPPNQNTYVDGLAALNCQDFGIIYTGTNLTLANAKITAGGQSIYFAGEGLRLINVTTDGVVELQINSNSAGNNFTQIDGSQIGGTFDYNLSAGEDYQYFTSANSRFTTFEALNGLTSNGNLTFTNATLNNLNFEMASINSVARFYDSNITGLIDQQISGGFRGSVIYLTNTTYLRLNETIATTQGAKAYVYLYNHLFASVINASSQPLANAQINVYDNSSTILLASMTSDLNGLANATMLNYYAWSADSWLPDGTQIPPFDDSAPSYLPIQLYSINFSDGNPNATGNFMFGNFSNPPYYLSYQTAPISTPTPTTPPASGGGGGFIPTLTSTPLPPTGIVVGASDQTPIYLALLGVALIFLFYNDDKKRHEEDFR